MHHITEAAISDSYKKEPSQDRDGKHVVRPKPDRADAAPPPPPLVSVDLSAQRKHMKKAPVSCSALGCVRHGHFRSWVKVICYFDNCNMLPELELLTRNSPLWQPAMSIQHTCYKGWKFAWASDKCCTQQRALFTHKDPCLVNCSTHANL